MKTKNILDEKDINKAETNMLDKEKKNNDEKNKDFSQNNNNNINMDDPDFDLNTFCPDPESADKKIRSKTVRESVKKGKLKQFIEEQKSNKIDQRKYLKTPQVMVPRLRPQKGKLNPTPLKLSSISLNSSKLNSIKEESVILSEREEESENSESSSSSFFSEEEKEEKHEIIHEVEEDIEEEKEETKEEEKELKNGHLEKEQRKKNEENKNEISPINDILENLKKEKNKEIKEEIDNNKEKNPEKEFEDVIFEDIIEEDEQVNLMEVRKYMKKERKSLMKKKKDTFNIIDQNIKNNYKKFKEDVLNDSDKPCDIDNNPKCFPILDFYANNMSLKEKMQQN